MPNQLHPSSPYSDINRLADGEIVHLASGIKLSFEQLIELIADQTIIHISEQHDNLAAHEVQLQIINAIYQQRNGKIITAMEMFRQDVQSKLDLLKYGTLSRSDFNQLFDQQWTPAWRPAYQPILDTILQNKIPVYGLKPTRQTEDIVRNGERDATTPQIDLEDIHHRNHFLPFFKAGKSPDKAEQFYRMMCLWDEAMAEQLAKIICEDKNKDSTIISIAGAGHIAYGFGIPKRCFRRHPHEYTTIIPVSEHNTTDAPPLLLGDYVWKVPYDKLELSA